jgi:hypothetical protein
MAGNHIATIPARLMRLPGVRFPVSWVSDSYESLNAVPEPTSGLSEG